jgi:glyoxylate reductase
MKQVVVITAELPPIAVEMLAGEFDVVVHPAEGIRSEEEMIVLLADADAAITLLGDPLTRGVLASNPHLRVVANYAVGYNNVDLGAARELGILVSNTPGVLTEATADLTMALLLAVTRRLIEGDAEIRANAHCKWEPLHHLGSGIQGKRFGIIGMGRIGCAVASRARAFGMEIVYTSRSEAADAGAVRLSLAELLATSDVVSIHCPLNEETRHLIDVAALARMKPTASLLNTSRGAIVDEAALCDALENGVIAGAGLDVYEHEPSVDPRLVRLPNTVLLPHIGSATFETRSEMARLAATNVQYALRGMRPPNLVV